MIEADFVIVGSGSAGAAMAYRLSQDGRHSVCVVEYGGTDYGPFIQMPAALSYPMNMRRYDWGFSTEPEPHLGGRVLATPRGKVLGGSSSINGMVYVRGHARDFDHWAEEGATGWSHAHVLPYFKRMEAAEGGEPGKGLKLAGGGLVKPRDTVLPEQGRKVLLGVRPEHLTLVSDRNNADIELKVTAVETLGAVSAWPSPHPVRATAVTRRAPARGRRR